LEEVGNEFDLQKREETKTEEVTLTETKCREKLAENCSVTSRGKSSVARWANLLADPPYSKGGLRQPERGGKRTGRIPLRASKIKRFQGVEAGS